MYTYVCVFRMYVSIAFNWILDVCVPYQFGGPTTEFGRILHGKFVCLFPAETFVAHLVTYCIHNCYYRTLIIANHDY